MTKTKTTQGRVQVITWADAHGSTIDICPTCANRLTGRWPKNPVTGEEYCQVQHGLHEAYDCDTCREDRHDQACIDSMGEDDYMGEDD